MIITRLGETSFKIESRGLSILINPEKSKIKPDIVLYSEEQKTQNYPESFVISSPGEYEVKGIFILGFSLNQNSAAYLIEVEDMNIFYFPAKELPASVMEELERVDILLADASSVKNIREIEPRLVIPMNYKKIEDFLKEAGFSKKDSLDKLVVKKKDLEGGGINVAVLKII